MASLLHEHDPTMDARIVHAVNVSNKKQIARLNHMSKSLAGSRDVALHIYRQEEKELVKQLFKLQHEKERRHPEIEYGRRHSIHSVPQTEQLIQSDDLTHSHGNHGGGSSANISTPQDPTSSRHHASSEPPIDSPSYLTLLQKQLQDAVYQPIGYGHGRKEYTGLHQSTGRRRHNSLPDEKFMSDFRSHTTLGRSTGGGTGTVLNALEQLDPKAMPSRHQIDVHSHPQRQHSHSLAFLDPSTQSKKAAASDAYDAANKDTKPSAEVVHDEDNNLPPSPPLSPEERVVTGSSLESSPLPKHMASSVSKLGGQTSKGRLTGTRSKHAGGVHRKPIEGQQNKRKTVMFAETSSRSPSSTHGIRREITSSGMISHPSAHRANSSMESMYDMGRRESSTRAIIEHEHHKVDSLLQSFRQSFPVKKELDWQKTHPRASPSSQRGPFVAHTPPHQVSSQDSCNTDDRTHIHGDIDHQHHQHDRHFHEARPSHANVSRASHANVSRTSHANVSRHGASHDTSSHANVSHGSLGHRNDSMAGIYNLPKEAVEDYRNLMEQASHAAHHPSAREAHAAHTEIPHSHPPRNLFKKSRQKLLALHLLANQQKQKKAARESPIISPEDALMCRYLRLSALNVETLVDMCKESGVPIGIHPHMSVEDVEKFVFKQEYTEEELNGHPKGPKTIGIPHGHQPDTFQDSS